MNVIDVKFGLIPLYLQQSVNIMFMRRNFTRFRRIAISLFVVIAIATICATSSFCANLVSGKFVSSKGRQIVLQLTVHSSSPINLIVEQFLPSGTQINNTKPRAKKISHDQKKVKWLFKKKQNQVLNLTTKLQTPLRGNVSAVVRYRTSKGGGLTEIRIAP